MKVPFSMSCIIKKKKPLQVSAVLLPFKWNQGAEPEKRAVLSVPGSLAVEAAMVLWIFLVSAIAFMMPMEFARVQLRVQMALETDLRRLCYQAEQERIWGQDEFYLAPVYWDWLDASCVVGGRTGITINCLREGDIIELDAGYQVSLPIALFGKREFYLQNSCSGRIWSGQPASLVGEKNQEQVVYVTPFGTAYHWYRDCSSLELTIYEKERDTIGEVRGEDGQKYYPCRYCCKAGKNTKLCYVTKYGQRYHEDAGCSRISRTVLETSVNETGSRHLCTRCKERRGKENP